MLPFLQNLGEYFEDSLIVDIFHDFNRVPYDINKVESKIKGQIMMDKKTNQHAMHEPVLVTSKKEMIEKLPTEGHSSDPIRQEIAENEPKQNVQATSNKPPLSQPQQVQPTAQASHSLKQQDVSKQPTRKVPSKRLEEILYQRKKVDSPRTEKGECIILR